ncbi:hydrogenase expression/formation protein HypE [Serpentinicella alkaliphila]|uniref:Hydrogenase maturation carbamoyl dehydratase HypE n=1 Tax=Serpentinicella alkaliphila TaxID=1734049 RepID=A0A4R2T022_9FIRM|nr:hydrogenase expression/formation protein HypE [Serpentinicella alkaliphila]QUH26402.1 hydrogenase expression/formation protein HypE [Serpentinicella alkaliphila]TCP96177.1 hydrogenase maturation carbamoyl dehydratase HypE [Serpentinicella alkaliphila]
MNDKVLLRYGDGGKHTNLLIRNIFYKHFHNDMLVNYHDASVFDLDHGRLAFTTDSFVVKPLVFPGGDIGKLAVCGTINDLVTAGAKPLYLSCGFIIEEGFDIKLIEKIAESMGEMCRKTGVKIITGDTKVVEKGAVDGVFINTSGIGVVQAGYQPKTIQEGDQIIITGGIAEHGTTIAVERFKIKVEGNIKSDCSPLNHIIERIQPKLESIRLMKDPTRGGLATALNEIVEMSGKGIRLLEKAIPISSEVKSINELLGLDPLYHACEGRLIIIVEKQNAEEVLDEIRRCEGCEDATIIGGFDLIGVHPRVVMETYIGGRRIVSPLEADMLPRIC